MNKNILHEIGGLSIDERLSMLEVIQDDFNQWIYELINKVLQKHSDGESEDNLIDFISQERIKYENKLYGNGQTED